MARYGNRPRYGRSKPRTAFYDKVCAGCGSIIKAGTLLCFDDKPHRAAVYHPECPTVEVAAEPKESVKQPIEWEEDGETSTSSATETTETIEVEARSKPRREPEHASAAGSIDAAIDARIDSKLGAFRSEEAIEQAVERIAERVVQKSVDPETLRVTIRDEVMKLNGRVNKYEIKVPKLGTIERTGCHYLYPRLLKLLHAGFHVILWGPRGTGKTTAAMDAAIDLKRKGEVDTLDASTFKSAVLGFMNAAGKKVETIFTDCYETGKIYIADELDAAPANVQTLFNSALANGHCPTPSGSIKKHKLFAFVGTANTPLRPTANYPDRKRGSEAFKDRLYFMYWPLDPAIECKAAGLPCPPAPERAETTCSPAEWVTWVQAVRAMHIPEIDPGQRASLEGIRALSIGENPEEVAHALVFRGADQPMIDKVLRANPLPSHPME